MNLDTYILISGYNENTAIQALQQFSDMYASSGVTNYLSLFRYNKSDKILLVNASDTIDKERFKYLVNYLQYPENINDKVEAVGYMTMMKPAKSNDNINAHRIMFYISPDDQEYDNVFGIFSDGGNTIKFGFAIGENYIDLGIVERPFNEPQFTENEFALIKIINPGPDAIKNNKKGCAPLLFTFGLISFCLTWLLM